MTRSLDVDDEPLVYHEPVRIDPATIIAICTAVAIIVTIALTESPLAAVWPLVVLVPSGLGIMQLTARPSHAWWGATFAGAWMMDPWSALLVAALLVIPRVGSAHLQGAGTAALAAIAAAAPHPLAPTLTSLAVAVSTTGALRDRRDTTHLSIAGTGIVAATVIVATLHGWWGVIVPLAGLLAGAATLFADHPANQRHGAIVQRIIGAAAVLLPAIFLGLAALGRFASHAPMELLVLGWSIAALGVIVALIAVGSATMFRFDGGIAAQNVAVAVVTAAGVAATAAVGELQLAFGVALVGLALMAPALAVAVSTLASTGSPTVPRMRHVASYLALAATLWAATAARGFVN